MREFNFRGERLDGLYEKYATGKISNCVACTYNEFVLWAETGPLMTGFII